MLDLLPRISKLAKKQREDYLRAIRGRVLHTFSGMKVVDSFLNDVTPEKIRKLKTKD